MAFLLTDVYYDDATETIDDAIYELLEGLPNTLGAPTGVHTVDGNPEVRFDGPAHELQRLHERLGLEDD